MSDLPTISELPERVNEHHNQVPEDRFKLMSISETKATELISRLLGTDLGEDELLRIREEDVVVSFATDGNSAIRLIYTRTQSVPANVDVARNVVNLWLGSLETLTTWQQVGTEIFYYHQGLPQPSYPVHRGEWSTDHHSNGEEEFACTVPDGFVCATARRTAPVPGSDLSHKFTVRSSRFERVQPQSGAGGNGRRIKGEKLEQGKGGRGGNGNGGLGNANVQALGRRLMPKP